MLDIEGELDKRKHDDTINYEQLSEKQCNAKKL